MTIATQLVLRALLADPTRELYGSEIGDAAGLMSGDFTRSWPGWSLRLGGVPPGRMSTPQAAGRPRHAR